MLGKYSKIGCCFNQCKINEKATQSMRVLMVSKACLVGVYQRKLEEIAAHDDVDLMVIVPPGWRDPAGLVELERLYTNGYQMQVDPIRFNGNFHFHYYPRLKQRLVAFQPDIVHIDEEPYNLATWLAWRQARSVGAKTLFFSWQNLLRAYPPPFSWMEQQVLQGVDYALVGNQASAEVWRAKGYGGPLAVIPQFGVDPTLFQPQETAVFPRAFTIGAANRRLVPEKGMDLLLRAVAQLPGEWRVRITGEGPEKRPLITLARELGIADRVQFEGTIGSAEMPAFLRQIDVLVLASRTLPNWKEQFGRVLVEAMASGVPVIGSDSGEIPHVIGEAGLIFPEDDEQALLEHLRTLMHDGDARRQLAENGRWRVMAQYTQRQVAEKTVAVYRKMVGS